MAETAKTWTQVEQDIADTMRKWRVWDYVLDAPFGKLKAAERRQATRMGQTMEQRSVNLRFEWRSPYTMQKRTIKLTLPTAKARGIPGLLTADQTCSPEGETL